MCNNFKSVTVAGGCFWCMVDCFYLLEGVKDVIVGYAGGSKINPTYAEVKSQTTGYYEVAKVIYDERLTSYEEVLEMFWRQINPTDEGGQFQDRGSSYRTAIFYENEEDRVKALESKKRLEELNKFNKPIVTKILPLKNFYKAEEYHQNFSKKNPEEYKEDRKKSGRDEFLKDNWK
ncbi:peptide-methionine (S)-S-oxide reductase MsrA [Haloimpatiens sp. FM7315]|uniref:peptide-methionine (S)-S-oxide reductase MsrA n=1 Tax=Haloimpatiens sp. FM7315 TaxID=3298609 RepID=UPI0035A35F92